MSQLYEFLSDLAVNPRKQIKFKKDPRQVARDAGLSEDAVEAVATRNSAQLRDWMVTASTAVIYSPETAIIYSPETAMIYSPETAIIYSAGN